MRNPAPLAMPKKYRLMAETPDTPKSMWNKKGFIYSRSGWRSKAPGIFYRLNSAYQ
ncbi:hypothetical protein EHW99_0057 [Erwinia amylovora]|nr:hypothetical protein EHX00_0057 [Erwinia amylovora]CCO84498.1 hypothetical protein BN434_0059 [Erwinia amylovora CFBP 2585]CCO97393.1 hypothetical protein BN438_0060 [Erwinia amylovora UPN527]QJQ56462.1 hypothetical protein EHW99_0057 [Erwinia amylovora]QJQ60161.1 hypothetical protein EHW98_0057 [Erwinia amylovora]